VECPAVDFGAMSNEPTTVCDNGATSRAVRSPVEKRPPAGHFLRTPSRKNGP
jgi:hypothetical protein